MESVSSRVNGIGSIRAEKELRPLMDALYTELAATRTLANSLRSSLANLISGGMVSSAALAIGSTNTAVSSGLFLYMINGVMYSKAAVAAGTAPGNDIVPQNKYGAVAFDIGADGTIDAVEAAANSTGYTTALLAVAGLPAVAANHVRMGYVTAMNTAAGFTFGTTALDTGTVTEVYTSTTGVLADLGTAITQQISA